MCRTSLLAVLVALSLAVPASAQEPPPPDPVPRTVDERSPVLAGVVEWAVPTVGYAYAGSWSRGIPSALARIVGIGLVLENLDVNLFGPSSCPGPCKVGWALAVSGTLWGVIDAGRTATRENERRRSAAADRSVQLYPRVGSDGVGLGLRVVVP